MCLAVRVVSAATRNVASAHRRVKDASAHLWSFITPLYTHITTPKNVH